MPIVRFVSAAVCLMLVPLLLSCKSQPAGNPMVGQMIDPKITAVTDGGKQAKVNMGLYDEVYVGQRLYVIRGNKFIGMMTVIKSTNYESECAVLTANTKSPAEKVQLADVKVGDLVVRKFQELAKAGQYREKVPRMVPIPYEPQKTATQAEIDKRVEKAVAEKKIPRELVDQWKKEHPLKSIMQQQTGQ